MTAPDTHESTDDDCRQPRKTMYDRECVVSRDMLHSQKAESPEDNGPQPCARCWCPIQYDREWLCIPLLSGSVTSNGVDVLIDVEWAERISHGVCSN